MDAKVIWQNNLSFTGSAESGFSLALGADSDVGGAADGFRPMELFAIGLAGCTGMDVISILRKKRQEVTGFDVQVHADRAESHPKVFTRALIEFHITGQNISESAVLRAIELSTTTYCPAQAMLGQIMPIDIQYHIYEDSGAGNRQLVSTGNYKNPVKFSD